ncbi:MAG: O-antigen ligase family protein, partial [Eubacterium callanderi]
VSGVFALLTLVFLLVNSGFGARFLSVFADLSKMLRGDDWEKGGSYRLFIWSKTLELIRMRPLTGFGIETLGQVMGQYFEKDIIRVTGRHLVIDRAHNEYLHIAVSSGIPAALSYLAFEGTTLYHGLKNWRRSPMLVPLVCSIAAYMAAACFNISVVTVAPVFWVFCGIAVRLSGEIQSNLNMI